MIREIVTAVGHVSPGQKGNIPQGGILRLLRQLPERGERRELFHDRGFWQAGGMRPIAPLVLLAVTACGGDHDDDDAPTTEGPAAVLCARRP